MKTSVVDCIHGSTNDVTTKTVAATNCRQVSKAILGDKKPLTTRPSAALAPADFAAVKAALQNGRCGEVLGEVTDELVVSSLLYPKVGARTWLLYCYVTYLVCWSTGDGCSNRPCFLQRGSLLGCSPPPEYISLAHRVCQRTGRSR